MQPIRVEVKHEADGRVLASVPDLPGVMAYGAFEDEAVRKVKAIALQVLADMIEHGEEIPEPLKGLFASLYHMTRVSTAAPHSRSGFG